MAEPRWANEDWEGTSPPEDICCADCVLREEDRKLGDDFTIKGHTLGICKVFPKMKPNDVLWGKEKCPYYVSEKEE